MGDLVIVLVFYRLRVCVLFVILLGLVFCDFATCWVIVCCLFTWDLLVACFEFLVV